MLDEKPMRAGEDAFVLPSPVLAEAVAAEWQAQPEEFDPRSLMMTRFAGSVIDVDAEMQTVRRMDIEAYLDTDLLCYYGSDGRLQERQRRIWHPILSKVATHYAIELEETEGIMPLHQSAASKQVIQRAIEAYDAMQLTALWHLTLATGSVYLAIAVMELEVTAEDAIAATQLEEQFQADLWGEDTEAAAARQAKAEHIGECVRFIALVKQAKDT
mgnify:FL=1